MRTNTLNLAIIATAFMISSCDKNKHEADKTPTITFQDSYAINASGLYPEGIDFDSKNNVFLVGSFHKGTVYTLSADGKTFRPFINDEKLVATLGVYTDEASDRYIVVSGDAGASERSGANGSTAGKVAYVGFYDAQDGKLIKAVDLAVLTPNSGALPNDIAVDKEGNTYITNSFSPVIYKISKDYTTGIFTTNGALFTPAAGSFGLNGIVYHPDGYLLVAKTNDNKLFKIPIANPQDVKEITGLADKIKAPDGLELTHDNNLVVIENGLAGGKVHIISSSDAWTSARHEKEETIGTAAFPTTAVRLPNNAIYVLQSKLGALLGGDKTQSAFSIKKTTIK